ncbi:transposon-encoded TnpW family protein [Streptococcus cristatus]|uniref:transposon-encoded TnpW family protein n=1 Tax=Streptococcus cristatus TaxID=45634 RepID=UPI000F67983D|nr:transposon-encoded TnpW family protein [Streptococcus cristatus]
MERRIYGRTQNTDKKGISTKRKIGKSSSEVLIHFNENTTETMQDKLTRIMLRELRRESDEKKDDFDEKVLDK